MITGLDQVASPFPLDPEQKFRKYLPCSWVMLEDNQNQTSKRNETNWMQNTWDHKSSVTGMVLSPALKNQNDRALS